jgi:hypothetical protein
VPALSPSLISLSSLLLMMALASRAVRSLNPHPPSDQNWATQSLQWRQDFNIRPDSDRIVCPLKVQRSSSEQMGATCYQHPRPVPSSTRQDGSLKPPIGSRRSGTIRIRPWSRCWWSDSRRKNASTTNGERAVPGAGLILALLNGLKRTLAPWSSLYA